MGGGATLGRVTMDTHSDGVKTVKRLEGGKEAVTQTSCRDIFTGRKSKGSEAGASCV